MNDALPAPPSLQQLLHYWSISWLKGKDYNYFIFSPSQKQKYGQFSYDWPPFAALPCHDYVKNADYFDKPNDEQQMEREEKKKQTLYKPDGLHDDGRSVFVSNGSDVLLLNLAAPVHIMEGNNGVEAAADIT